MLKAQIKTRKKNVCNNMFFLERSEFSCQKLPNKTPCPDENSVKSVFKQAVEEEQTKVTLCDSEGLERNHGRKN